MQLPSVVRVSQILSIHSCRPATTPQIRSECPAKYLVPECITRSMPNSAGCWLMGVPNVASIMLSSLCCLASSTTFLKSTTRRVGLVGDSRYSNFVFGRIARACCSYSVVSTNVVSIPIFGSHCERNLFRPRKQCRSPTLDYQRGG